VFTVPLRSHPRSDNLARSSHSATLSGSISIRENGPISNRDQHMLEEHQPDAGGEGISLNALFDPYQPKKVAQVLDGGQA